ncbi:hypothetical protein D3C85_1289390 [compost metagenome]
MVVNHAEVALAFHAGSPRIQAGLRPEEMKQAEQCHACLAGPRSRGGDLRLGRSGIVAFIRRDSRTLLQPNLELDLHCAVIQLLHHTAAVGAKARHAGVDTVVDAVFAMLGASLWKAGEMESVGIGSAVD